MNRGSISIFSKQFKTHFNKAKYSTLAKEGKSALNHPTSYLQRGNALEYYSATLTFMLIFSMGFIANYYFPDSFYEIVAHKSYHNKYHNYDSLIGAEEAEANAKIIAREKKEQKLEHFLDSMKNEMPHH